MHAPKIKKLTTTHDADRLFASMVRTIEGGKYTVTDRDDERRLLGFASGKTLMSWGHEYIASVAPTADGANVELMCGGFDDKPKALLDGRKNMKAADAVLAAVKADLDSLATSTE